MGTTQTYKDPSINVFIALGKTFYYAGEMVQGVVHVNCLANKPYTQLLLILQGKERINWQQSSGDSSTDYNNSRETYNQVMPFHRFPNGIQAGQFSFPFSMLLPAAFPASFDLGPRNFIKYIISVIFVPFRNQSQSPIYEKSLHLREPARLPQGQMGFRLQEFAPIMCCCCDSGQVELTLQCDAAAIIPGQHFRVTGRINNIGGSEGIDGYRIVLRQAIKKVTERGQYSATYRQRFVLHQNRYSIPIGRDRHFDLQLRAPLQGLTYTAIGNIIYRAYFLELEAHVDACCYKSPRIMRHVIVNSDMEPADEYSGVQAPPIWNPEIAPPVAFLNLQPYIYQPHRLIDARNQFGMPSQDRNMNRGPLANQIVS